MASLFKKRVTRYFNSAGRRVNKGTPGARKKTLVSRCWYGRYLDANERPREVKLARVTDKNAALAMVNELEHKAQRQRAGLSTRLDDQRKRPLAEHLAEFRQALDAKDNTPDTNATCVARIRAVFDGCGFQTLADLDAGKVAQWLAAARRCRRSADGPRPEGKAASYADIAKAFNVAERTVTYWRRHGAPIRPRGESDLAKIAAWRREREAAGLSKSTSNHYLTAVKSFGWWLVRDRRAAENPFAYLSALNTEDDLRRERRPLSDGEFSRLVEAARGSSWVFRGLSGADRAMLYITAAYTGLRAAELASLTDSSLDLESGLPTAAVKACYSKRRRRDVQPLRPDLARLLSDWLADRTANAAPALEAENGPVTLRLPRGGRRIENERERPPEARLWPGTWYENAAEMLRHDLAAAGIPYEDAAGRVFDFHALRHHFISNLARGKVHPKTAQTLARHSKITLTMDRYTHLAVADVAGALEGLPELPNPQPLDAARATGTDATDVRVRFGCTKSQASSVVSCLSTPLVSACVHKETGPQETPKPLECQGFIEASKGVASSEADGTRTRNHWIDSPVL